MEIEDDLNYSKKQDFKKSGMDVEDEGDWEEENEEDNQVEFEFYDPNPAHYASVRGLVNGYLDGASYNSSELANIIVEQVSPYLQGLIPMQTLFTRLSWARWLAVRTTMRKKTKNPSKWEEFRKIKSSLVLLRF